MIAQEALRLQQRSGELKRELSEAQIAQSSYRVHRLEEEMRLVWRNPILYRQIIQGRLPLLFERDRATLKLIIRETPELAPQAQAVLDQIAILMGFISDQPNPCPIRNLPPDLPNYPTAPCKGG